MFGNRIRAVSNPTFFIFYASCLFQAMFQFVEHFWGVLKYEKTTLAEMEPQLSNNKEEVGNEAALEESAGQSTASTPCRAFRGRDDGCLQTEGTCPPETNGAATSVAGSGRVLRDRSTRAIPVWRQSDIGEVRGEVTRDVAANRRRKAKCPRRRKSAGAAQGSSNAASQFSVDCVLPNEYVRLLSL